MNELVLYLSGPMSGVPDYNRPLFHATAKRLRDEGYIVINPAEHELEDGATWEEYLHDDIELLLRCNAVAVLPDWKSSRGATFEVFIATKLGMPIYDAETMHRIDINYIGYTIGCEGSILAY